MYYEKAKKKVGFVIDITDFFLICILLLSFYAIIDLVTDAISINAPIAHTFLSLSFFEIIGPTSPRLAEVREKKRR